MSALENRVAVITGAGRGIGRAVAIGFADAGAKVVCAARTDSQIEEVVAEIRASGGEALAQRCDITDLAQVQDLFDVAADSFGGVDIVLGNAGAQEEHGPIEDSDPGQWAAIVNANLIGAYHTARCAIPHLRHSDSGKMIFTGSGGGHRALPNISAYACAKAGLRMLVRVVAAEVAKDGIAVNELVPGLVDTDMLAQVKDTEAFKMVPEVEWVKQPEDVVPLALFLATLPGHGPSAQTFSLTRREI